MNKKLKCSWKKIKYREIMASDILKLKRGDEILAYDPKADYTDFLNINTFFNISNSINDLIKSVDYVVLMTEWEDFKNYDWSSVKKNMAIFDTKNFLNINNPKIKYFSL